MLLLILALTQTAQATEIKPSTCKESASVQEFNQDTRSNQDCFQIQPNGHFLVNENSQNVQIDTLKDHQFALTCGRSKFVYELDPQQRVKKIFREAPKMAIVLDYTAKAECFDITESGPLPTVEANRGIASVVEPSAAAVETKPVPLTAPLPALVKKTESTSFQRR